MTVVGRKKRAPASYDAGALIFSLCYLFFDTPASEAPPLLTQRAAPPLRSFVSHIPIILPVVDTANLTPMMVVE